MNYYHLPFEVKEETVASNKLYTKPILPLFTADGQFYILALSKNEVRLFKAARQMVKEIEMKNAPRSMLDMEVDDDSRTKLQLRTSSPQGGTVYSDKVPDGGIVTAVLRY